MGLKSFLQKFGLFKEVTPVADQCSIPEVKAEAPSVEVVKAEATKVIEDRLAEVAKERKEEAKVVVKEEPKVTAKEIKAKLKKVQPVEVNPTPTKKVVKAKAPVKAKSPVKVAKPAKKK